MIGYHWRALRYRHQLWKSHQESLGQFLSAWQTQDRLILVGPSAGYNLPTFWLDRFSSILVVEPDPVGRLGFERIHSSIRKKLIFDSEPLDFGRIDGLLRLRPERSSILFANLLGQISVENVTQVRRSLTAALYRQSWASFHDRFSGREVIWKTPYGWSDRPLETASLVDAKKTGEIQEHLATDFFKDLWIESTFYWDWQVAPHQVHLIEGVIGGVPT